MCPTCREPNKIVKSGFYKRKSDDLRVQRYYCKLCRKYFSRQTFRIDYRYRKRHLDQIIFRLMSEGNSIRGSGRILRVKPETIARRIKRFGYYCRQNLETYRTSRPDLKRIMFDELETFEHTKCKPLTVPIVVEEKTRKIIAVAVGQIAAKGKLAKISVKKYGPRKCQRRQTLRKILTQTVICASKNPTIKTDQSRHYPLLIREFFPKAQHIAYKGRRGCIVGAGELKAGGFDPLFSLNQTYAMFRDHLRCLVRRTWCTNKRQDRLLDRLSIYSWYHNLYLDGQKYLILKNDGSAI